MKGLLSIVLIVSSGLIGWILTDGFLKNWRENNPDDRSITPHRITLERKAQAGWAKPNRLSMEWLTRLNERMRDASLVQLRALREEIGGWPTMANQLGSSLCSAYLYGLAPHERTLVRSSADQRRAAAALFNYWLDVTIEPPQDIPSEMLLWLREDDLVAVLQAIDHRGERFLSESVRDHFIKYLAEHDSSKALAVANGLSNKRERLEQQGSVVGVWAKHDVEAAMRWLEKLPQGRDRSQLGQHLVSVLDPVEILEQADRLVAIGVQSDPRTTAYRRWASQDVEAAQAWLTDNPDSKMAAAMAQSLASASPELAAAMVEFINDPTKEAYAVDNVMEWYVRKDRIAALGWARGLVDESARTVALLGAAKELAYADPEAAKALFGEVVEKIGDKNLGVLAANLAYIEDRQPGLIEPLDVVERFDGRTVYYLSNYVHKLAKSDPVNALAIFESLWSKAEAVGERPPHAYDLWKHLLAHDAEAAAGLFADQSHSMMKANARAFFNEWKDTDPRAALAWVEASLEPDSEIYGQLLRPIGEVCMEEGRFAQALRTFQSIPKEQQIPDHLWERLFSGWHKEDPVAALSAFETTSIESNRWERWVKP